MSRKELFKRFNYNLYIIDNGNDIYKKLPLKKVASIVKHIEENLYRINDV